MLKGVQLIYLTHLLNDLHKYKQFGDYDEYFLKMYQLIIFFCSLCYNWIIWLVAVKNNYFEILNIITIFILNVYFLYYVVIVH